MKEVDYVVSVSPIMPEKVIYAGTLNRKNKRDLKTWRTRKDVTNMVSNAFLEMCAAKCNEERGNSKGIQGSWNDVNGYKITIKVEKRKN